VRLAIGLPPVAPAGAEGRGREDVGGETQPVEIVEQG
jgi:hypothetical protein